MSKLLPPLIVILGPTAVGKTGLSALLCERYRGEVVSADSRQIYREMDIGTAKPTADELVHAPHHLIDIRNPDETLSLAQFQTLAHQAISQLHNAGNQPFLIGGSALYLRGIVEGLKVPEVPPDPELRNELEAIGESDGWEPLFARLQQLDPLTAERIDARNIRRVVRALEIVITTGKSKTELEGKEPPPYRILTIGLDRPREELYQRVDQRVDQMIKDGLVDETKQLLANGYSPQLPALSSLGYRQVFEYLDGEKSLEESIERIKTETHRFVRHQYTWFRKMEDIHWFQMSDDLTDNVCHLIDEFLLPTELTVRT